MIVEMKTLIIVEMKTLMDTEYDAWQTFLSVVKGFLLNRRDDNYVNLVNSLLESFHKFVCNMSIKVHFLHSHLNAFPENLGDVSDEQGERFHQDIQTMEERYQGTYDTRMLEPDAGLCRCSILQKISLKEVLGFLNVDANEYL